MFARFVNMGIAMWVMVAAAAWHPTAGLMASMLIAGIGVFAAEAAGFWKNKYRFVTTAFGALLLFSGFVFATRSDFLIWNNFLCGVAMVVMSMVQTRVSHGDWVPWSRQRSA